MTVNRGIMLASQYLRRAVAKPLGVAVFASLLFVAIGFVKTADLFIRPRFWGEEGGVFFSQLYNATIWEALTFQYKGSGQILTGLLVWIAAKVPLSAAPALTTYGAFALQAAVAALIGVWAWTHRLSIVVTILLVAAWSYLPATYEIWATSTSIQWTCGVAAVFILTLDVDEMRRRTFFWSVVVGVCGLSGVPACMVAPFFFGLAILERSRARAVPGMVLAVCALIQFYYLSHAELEGRALTVNVLATFFGWSVQTILTPLLGVSTTTVLLQERQEIWPLRLIAALGIWLAGGLVIAAWQKGHRAIVLVAVGAWLLITILCVYGAIGSQFGIVSAIAGARYFLIGSILFCIIAALGTKSSRRIPQRACLSILFCVAIVGVVDRFSSPAIRFYLSGPEWRSELKACRSGEICRPRVWPLVSEWRASIPAH